MNSGVTSADHKAHWDEKFRSRPWGRYPPEDLVRFVSRSFAAADRSSLTALEVGCGPGANLWYLHREGFSVAGLDGSPTAIELAASRLARENRDVNSSSPDLRVGDLSSLPWNDRTFDLVVDVFAIYANPLTTIRKAVSEAIRVLKPGGRFYSKVWGRRTSGFGEGRLLEAGTFDEIPFGPCKDMGVSHFFDAAEIADVYAGFRIRAVDVVLRSDQLNGLQFEELLIQADKPHQSQA